MRLSLRDVIGLARQLVTEHRVVSRSSLRDRLCEEEKRVEDIWVVPDFPFAVDGIKVVAGEEALKAGIKNTRGPEFGLSYLATKADTRWPMMAYCEEYAFVTDAQKLKAKKTLLPHKDNYWLEFLDKYHWVEDARPWRAARIVIQNKLNKYCRRRFLETKELAQIYTNSAVPANQEKQFLEDALYNESLEGLDYIADVEGELKPEAIGFYMAVEVLFPWCLRGNYDVMCREMKDGCTDFQVAKAFLIPEYVIHHIRKIRFAHGNYLDISRQINADLDRESPICSFDWERKSR